MHMNLTGEALRTCQRRIIKIRKEVLIDEQESERSFGEYPGEV